jgi:phosphatidylethanolamine/phosphatidyl-N-methylethanolamine N-methyltransferase
MRPKLAELDTADVRRAYRRWAPVYDSTFGRFVEAGVKEATKLINTFHGRVLEVGVGTGLALPHYKPHLRVTGVDLSPEMLRRARERVQKKKLSNIEALLEMDATALEFPDASFDVSTAMYVMTVVPEPTRVMHELARVTKPGGHVVIVNHFSAAKGPRALIEKQLAGFADVLGWRPEFPVETIFVSDELALRSRRELKPFGLFTLLHFIRLP